MSNYSDFCKNLGEIARLWKEFFMTTINHSDVLYGVVGNNYLSGGAGDDFLIGGAGNDTLFGGMGFNRLEGGAGDDVYLQVGLDVLGSVIFDTSGYDIVEFADRISPSDIWLVKDYNHLQIRFSQDNPADCLTIECWFGGVSCPIEEFRFADGTVWTPSDLALLGVTIYGSSTFDNLYAGAGSVFSTFYTIYGYDGNDTLFGGDDNDYLDGGAGNDYLSGGKGDDFLFGGAGNDTLLGGEGNDTLFGGLGFNRLEGGAGDDVYLQVGLDVLGSVIFDTSGYDIVEFADRISISDIWLVKDGQNLQIRFSDSDPMDRLTISSWFGGASYQIEEFRFADGAVWTPSDLALLGVTIFGTSGNDFLSGAVYFNFNTFYTIYGGDGDDQLLGGNGDDVLYGGDGNDYLFGGDGNDVLNGETGNDTLQGGAGNDTYIFGAGFGQDIIIDYDPTPGNTDTVLLGVNPIDVVFARASSNLDITLHGTTDKLTVQSWYSGSAYQVEVIIAADGRTLLNSQVDQLVQAMSVFCSDNGLSNWDQAISQRPQEVQALLAQYWAA